MSSPYHPITLILSCYPIQKKNRGPRWICYYDFIHAAFSVWYWCFCYCLIMALMKDYCFMRRIWSGGIRRSPRLRAFVVGACCIASGLLSLSTGAFLPIVFVITSLILNIAPSQQSSPTRYPLVSFHLSPFPDSQSSHSQDSPLAQSPSTS